VSVSQNPNGNPNLTRLQFGKLGQAVGVICVGLGFLVLGIVFGLLFRVLDKLES
jgi:hypothetical protein